VSIVVLRLVALFGIRDEWWTLGVDGRLGKLPYPPVFTNACSFTLICEEQLFLTEKLRPYLFTQPALFVKTVWLRQSRAPGLAGGTQAEFGEPFYFKP
jgi:hypothetical protein